MKIRLKELRQSQNVFQAEFAEVIGINQSSLSRKELSSSSEVTNEQYKRLCERFGESAVNGYIVTEQTVFVSNNNSGGTQSNNVTQNINESESLQVIKEQAETIERLAMQYVEMNKQLIEILKTK